MSQGVEESIAQLGSVLIVTRVEIAQRCPLCTVRVYKCQNVSMVLHEEKVSADTPMADTVKMLCASAGVERMAGWQMHIQRSERVIRGEL